MRRGRLLIFVVGVEIALEVIHFAQTGATDRAGSLITESLYEPVAGGSTDRTRIRSIVVVVQITADVTFPMHYCTIYIQKTQQESGSSITVR